MEETRRQPMFLMERWTLSFIIIIISWVVTCNFLFLVLFFLIYDYNYVLFYICL
jgi:hypothetical protein